MFKSYLKMAWRSLLRNKAFSILNLAGLAIGMAAALLIGLLQALTQIQDQTVSFVPKIIAMATDTHQQLPTPRLGARPRESVSDHIP